MLPAHNEEENIDGLVAAVDGAMSPTELAFELIIAPLTVRIAPPSRLLLSVIALLPDASV